MCVGISSAEEASHNETPSNSNSKPTPPSAAECTTTNVGGGGGGAGGEKRRPSPPAAGKSGSANDGDVRDKLQEVDENTLFQRLLPLVLMCRTRQLSSSSSFPPAAAAEEAEEEGSKKRGGSSFSSSKMTIIGSAQSARPVSDDELITIGWSPSSDNGLLFRICTLPYSTLLIFVTDKMYIHIHCTYMCVYIYVVPFSIEL